MDLFVVKWASASSLDTSAIRSLVELAAVLANDLVDPPPSVIPLVSPCLDLLESLFPDESGFHSDLACLFADILTDTPIAFPDPDDPEVNDILSRPPMVADPTNHNASYDSSTEKFKNNNIMESVDGPSNVGSFDSSDKYSIPFPDDVTYPDDDWTNSSNFSDYGGDDGYDDDGYADVEEY